MKIRQVLAGVFFLTALVLFTNCKSTESDLSLRPIFQMNLCYFSQTWDSTRLANHLIGEWEWEKSYSYGLSPDSSFTESIGYSVEFFPDNTLMARQDGEIQDSAQWMIERNENYTGMIYRIRLVENYIGLLVGDLYFCDDQMEIRDSPADGCDEYFRKVE